jgi:peptide-methionine (S)-S-oxide reductase
MTRPTKSDPSAASLCRGRLNPFNLTAALAAALTCLPMNAQDPPAPAPQPALELASLGGGCFWCLEAVFERFRGVQSVTSGYAGGQSPNPSYKEVCSGRTGHAEVVQIAFDPSAITYAQLLEIFWEAHDPTTLNRQGADEGTQYRSIILFHNEAQKLIAEKSRRDAATSFKDPIVTELAPLKTFYPAEESHQDFFRRNPQHPYCVVVISPKLKKLEKLKPQPKPGSPQSP